MSVHAALTVTLMYYPLPCSYRLQQELTSLCADETQKYHTSLSALEFNFHSPPSKANCTTWVGGKWEGRGGGKEKGREGKGGGGEEGKGGGRLEEVGREVGGWRRWEGRW